MVTKSGQRHADFPWGAQRECHARATVPNRRRCLKQTLEQVISAFGQSAKSKLASAAVQGEPEDQLRAPFEQLLADMASLCGLPGKSVVAVGETVLAEERIRPDYAVTVGGALAGFVKLKAPGKGADPRRFRSGHDKAQWLRLQSLPNLIYTDGNEFSL